ncbi:hypothetical protein DSO57_1026359 [Entomophthora muscae]|uniref:Uncharacterized protein n=1 Tax=Entomophthora muscae TaxID=34485 RepID=A0ACC2SEM9_9FUNG|nr:hypothetical protein DSO57_1026359 [Entomophthora muscae]
MVNKMKTTSCSQHTIHDKQEDYQCFLNHVEYANNQKKLWDTVKDAQILAPGLYEDIAGLCCNLVAAEFQNKELLKSQDLLASTVLTAKKNYSSLPEQVHRNKTSCKEFEANVLPRLARLEILASSESSMSSGRKVLPVPTSSPEQQKNSSLPDLFDISPDHVSNDPGDTHRVPQGAAVPPLTPLLVLHASNTCATKKEDMEPTVPHHKFKPLNLPKFDRNGNIQTFIYLFEMSMRDASDHMFQEASHRWRHWVAQGEAQPSQRVRPTIEWVLT